MYSSVCLLVPEVYLTVHSAVQLLTLRIPDIDYSVVIQELTKCAEVLARRSLIYSAKSTLAECEKFTNAGGSLE